MESYKEVIFGEHGYLWLSYKGRAIRFIPVHIFSRMKKKRSLLRGDPKDKDDLILLSNFLKDNAQ